MSGAATIGALAVTAVSMVAEVGRRGILGERTTIAYVRLKEKLGDWLNGDASVLEDAYAVPAARERLRATIDRLPAKEKSALGALISALIEGLRGDVLRGALGINLQKLDSLRARLAEIAVGESS